MVKTSIHNKLAAKCNRTFQSVKNKKWGSLPVQVEVVWHHIGPKEGDCCIQRAPLKLRPQASNNLAKGWSAQKDKSNQCNSQQVRPSDPLHWHQHQNDDCIKACQQNAGQQGKSEEKVQANGCAYAKSNRCLNEGIHPTIPWQHTAMCCPKSCGQAYSNMQCTRWPSH